jgi:hypothetical protein
MSATRTAAVLHGNGGNVRRRNSTTFIGNHLSMVIQRRCGKAAVAWMISVV